MAPPEGEQMPDDSAPTETIMPTLKAARPKIRRRANDPKTPRIKTATANARNNKRAPVDADLPERVENVEDDIADDTGDAIGDDGDHSMGKVHASVEAVAKKHETGRTHTDFYLVCYLPIFHSQRQRPAALVAATSPDHARERVVEVYQRLGLDYFIPLVLEANAQMVPSDYAFASNMTLAHPVDKYIPSEDDAAASHRPALSFFIGRNFMEYFGMSSVALILARDVDEAMARLHELHLQAAHGHHYDSSSQERMELSEALPCVEGAFYWLTEPQVE